MQIPPHSIDALLNFTWRRFAIGGVILVRLLGLSSSRFWRVAFDLAHFFSARVGKGKPGYVLFSQVGLEIKINGRAVRWIFSRRGVVFDRCRLRCLLKAIRSARRKQMSFGRANLRRHLFERGNIVKYPETAAIRGDNQI